MCKQEITNELVNSLFEKVLLDDFYLFTAFIIRQLEKKIIVIDSGPEKEILMLFELIK
ncbi:hypothetical protein [Maribacter sp. 2210JD10-5]|uniref:hypothetical protein n=1 Tax=Maribacter sp. 2210JD10-5 TaxID=3386272 RepID=UPI0039BD0406